MDTIIKDHEKILSRAKNDINSYLTSQISWLESLLGNRKRYLEPKDFDKKGFAVVFSFEMDAPYFNPNEIISERVCRAVNRLYHMNRFMLDECFKEWLENIDGYTLKSEGTTYRIRFYSEKFDQWVNPPGWFKKIFGNRA